MRGNDIDIFAEERDSCRRGRRRRSGRPCESATSRSLPRWAQVWYNHILCRAANYGERTPMKAQTGAGRRPFVCKAERVGAVVPKVGLEPTWELPTRF